MAKLINRSRYFIERIRPIGYTPCSYNPVKFNCSECYAGISPCRLKYDKSLRFLRSSYKSNFAVVYQNDNLDKIAKLINILLKKSYPASVSLDRIFDHISDLDMEIKNDNLYTFLRTTNMFLETSSRMFTSKLNIPKKDIKSENLFYHEYLTPSIINHDKQWQESILNFKSY